MKAEARAGESFMHSLRIESMKRWNAESDWLEARGEPMCGQDHGISLAEKENRAGLVRLFRFFEACFQRSVRGRGASGQGESG